MRCHCWGDTSDTGLQALLDFLRALFYGERWPAGDSEALPISPWLKAKSCNTTVPEVEVRGHCVWP